MFFQNAGTNIGLFEVLPVYPLTMVLIWFSESYIHATSNTWYYTHTIEDKETMDRGGG